VANPNVVTEANLTGHLENGNGETPADEENETAKSPAQEREELALKDFELYEALNLLKGMALLQARSSGL